VKKEELIKMKPHGELTVKIARKISQILDKNEYKLLYDHGVSGKNVGKIVSWFGNKDKCERETELSQLDIAIIEQNRNKAIALVEIEETNDRPKTLLGDALCVLMGDHICFGGNYKILVDERTILIILGKSEVSHAKHNEKRNKYLCEKVMKIKSGLSTVNCVIGNVVIESFSGEEEMETQLSYAVKRALEGESSNGKS